MQSLVSRGAHQNHSCSVPAAPENSLNDNFAYQLIVEVIH